LFGNEGRGLPADVVRQGDLSVRIPMHGGASSLNLAVAAGVLLYEMLRQRRLDG
jgi:tRNA G18 (ribose-2'-O)-methylase SpoU